MIQSLSKLGYPGFSITDCGEVWSETSESWLAPSFDQRGYLLVNLNNFGTKRIHRLVAEAFIPNPENKSQVNHKNGVKTDNRVENLEWVTNLENAIHAERYGLMPHNLFTEYDVEFICEQLEEGKSCTEIARKYDFPYTAVYQIKRGENWKHISSKYNFRAPQKRNEKLSENLVRLICTDIVNDIPTSIIARKFNTSRDVVQKIRSGKNWRSISKEYF